MSSAIVYGVIGLVDPFRAVTALRASGRVLPPIAPALIVACSAMIGVNLLVRPDQVKRYLGQGRGVKALFLSSLAGILSMGPIHAWYPFLNELREKGVSDFHLANFLGCRAVKIPLLPLMAAYFGWLFTLVISAMMVLDAAIVAMAVSAGSSSR